MLLLAVVAAVSLAGCGDDEPSGPTDAQLLSALEGRTLTPAEVATKLETADLLCSLDAGVLQRVWLELDPDGFGFQNFVFTHRCPARELEFREAMATTTTVPRSTTTSTTTTTTAPLRPTTSRPPLGD
jgi:hypothetical protein